MRFAGAVAGCFDGVRGHAFGWHIGGVGSLLWKFGNTVLKLEA